MPTLFVGVGFFILCAHAKLRAQGELNYEFIRIHEFTNHMRILFVGGGTLGPVTPLIAVADFLKKRTGTVVLGLVGTRKGAERELAKKAGLPFYTITAGKWRRYFDVRNAVAPFAFLVGFCEALFLCARLRPTIIFSGGSFIGVPVIVAGWFLGIPSVTHQQDVEPSLANRLVAPFVKKITVTFEESARAFPAQKTVVTGNAVRAEIMTGDRDRAVARWGLETGVSTVLVFGGGTGARAINDLVGAALSELTQFCQIIHITGRGKSALSFSPSEGRGLKGLGEGGRYHSFELLTDEMADAYAVADLVVARAGVGTITELSALAKPAVIIPISGTHQEANAALLARYNAAAIYQESEFTETFFADALRSLLLNFEKRALFGENIKKIMSLDGIHNVSSVILETTK